jgi:2-polyprenyl-3-methyl-5-hydroxy-6-metoxy-1,4-benzoquinol methylase
MAAVVISGGTDQVVSTAGNLTIGIIAQRGDRFQGHTAAALHCSSKSAPIRRVIASVSLHNEAGPFGAIFPYAAMRQRKVLEIGCGMGSMAMNWAKHGADVSAIDLNPGAAIRLLAKL